MTHQAQTAPSKPGTAGLAKLCAKAVKSGLRRHLAMPAASATGRLKRWSPRPPRMTGAFASRELAIASLPKRKLSTYDHADVAAINVAAMRQTRVWDYPVMFWLGKLHAPGLRVLDAGGHFATKYVAFGDRLDLGDLAWTVYDLPATVRAARSAQDRGEIPAAVSFIDELSAASPFDLLLASGLLQYLDTPFHDFVAKLANRPRHILLNKVATRDGPTVVTLEAIGPARVPYQIRNREAFENGLCTMGYRIRDRWDIPSLGHVIGTHPELGRSTSRGYLLERTV